MSQRIPEAPSFPVVSAEWKRVIKAVQLFPDDHSFIPGGPLLRFVEPGNPIGDAFNNIATENNGSVTIAGIPLSYEGLRQLNTKVYFPGGEGSALCVDPRLEGGSHGGHEDCGMCKATSEAIRIPQLGNALLEQIGEQEFDPIHKQLRDGHRSITALFSLGSSVKPSDQLRFNRLMELGALSFHGTIDVEKIERAQQDDGPDLLAEATNFVAGIVSAVMMGGHNKYAEAAKEGPLVIIDTQGLPQSHSVIDRINKIMHPRETLFVNTKQ